MRTVFAIVFAVLIVATVPGTAQSAPMPPVPAGITAQLTDVMEVAWRRCWRDRWGRLHCRRCWRDRWGRAHCRRW